MTFDPHGDTVVRPAITPADAAGVAAEIFHPGTVKELGSNQDRNFLLTTAQNERYLLKFDNDATTDEDIRIQHAVLSRLAGQLPVPAPVRLDATQPFVRTVQVDGKAARVRVLSFVAGESLVHDGYLFPGHIARLGTLAGTVAQQLGAWGADIGDAGWRAQMEPANRLTAPAGATQWDLRNAMAVVEAYVDDVPPEHRAHVLSAAREAWDAVQELRDELPLQPIHGDITDDNVVGGRDAMGRVVPTGVIDWGDLSMGWRVAELAVTVSGILHHQRGHALEAMPAVVAFDEQVKLADAEIDALWPLVVLRAAVLVVSGAHQVMLEPDNTYAVERMGHEWEIFTTATSLDLDLAAAAVAAALKRPEIPVMVRRKFLLQKIFDDKDDDGDDDDDDDDDETEFSDDEKFVFSKRVSLDCFSDSLDNGAWHEPDIESRLAQEITDRTTRFVPSVARLDYGVPRLTRTRPAGPERPTNVTLFSQLFFHKETLLVAPFDCHVESKTDLWEVARGEGLLLTGKFGTIFVEVRVGEGLEEGPKRAGDVLGSVMADESIKIQWIRPTRSGRPLTKLPPLFTDVDSLPAWLRLTADPGLLFGFPSIRGRTPILEVIREERARAMPSAAERYYELPPEIARGWRDLLIDTNGRCYVDMVNNVASVGHAHPDLADAVSKQLHKLNTNSRFLYRSLAAYVEELREISPHPSLSSVLLVNSGSEAIELALRLASVHTGRKAVVALPEAYHGWTVAADAISTSAFDNPEAMGSRPDWVHVAPHAVNTYRGVYRGDDAAELYAAEIDQLLDDLDAKGTPAGAFICEPVFGNGGGIVYPDGYLKRVYESARAHGALCVADEVQVGLGRLGKYMWGVDQQGVVPDILVVAKALGAGFPLGAVYTTPEIAGSLAREGMLFSSAAGSPASVAAGREVLAIMRNERLQYNAEHVGAYLAKGLHELMDRHPLIGAVHGMGLYQGVELVLDRETREPATTETAWICERMLAYGVIVQPASERQNVLKVKPPLTLTERHADAFLKGLDGVLTEMEARTKQ